MPLQEHEVRALFAGLEAKGWVREDNTQMAPHRSIWLTRDDPWTGDLEDFRQRMRARLERIESNRGIYEIEAEYQGVWNDTSSLVEVLEALGHLP